MVILISQVNSFPFIGMRPLRIEGCSTWKYHKQVSALPHVRYGVCSPPFIKSQDITLSDEIGGLVMATHTFKEMLSHSTAVAQWDWNVGNNDVDQSSAVMPARTIPPGRRCEARMDYRRMCSYEVLEAIEGESIIIEQGEAFALNRSTEGILLLLALAPHAKQLIEVHTPRFGWGQTVNVFETRWVKPLQVEALGNLYLVGCQRIFGPLHYLSF
jgi:hypothetical protein